MARRLVNRFATDNFTAKVHFDAEWSEYRVTLWQHINNGIEGLRSISTYHTDDRADAVATAKHSLEWQQKQFIADAAANGMDADTATKLLKVNR